MSTRTMDVELELAGTRGFSVVTARVTEGLSEHTVARIEIASNEDLDFDAALTEPAIVRVVEGGDPVRRFTLRVSSVEFLRLEQSSRRYLVTLAHGVSSRLIDTGIGVFSSCAKSDTRSSASIHRFSSSSGSTIPACSCPARRSSYCFCNGST